MRRTRRYLHRSDAQPDLAAAFSFADTGTVAFTRAGAKHSELHTRGRRPAVKRVGGQRPLRVRGVGAVGLPLDGEQGRVVG